MYRISYSVHVHVYVQYCTVYMYNTVLVQQCNIQCTCTLYMHVICYSLWVLIALGRSDNKLQQWWLGCLPQRLRPLTFHTWATMESPNMIIEYHLVIIFIGHCEIDAADKKKTHFLFFSCDCPKNVNTTTTKTARKETPMQ